MQQSNIINEPNVAEVNSLLQKEIIRPVTVSRNAKVKSVDEILAELLPYIKADSPSSAAELDEGDTLDDKTLVVITIDFVKKIAQENNWDIAEYQGSFIAFNGQYWVKIGKELLKKFLSNAAVNIGVKYFKAHHFSFSAALLNQFIYSAFFETPISDLQETYINLSNGTYVINEQNQFLKPFDKKDYLMYKLNFPYDPNAKAPLFQKYLDEVLPVREKQNVLAEFIGYAFVKNSVLKLEKAAILLGSGQNGKSVFFEIISSLLGSENMSNVSLQTLTNPGSYSKPLLADKLLNYATEISTKMDTTEFKTLVSGEPIVVRQIRERPFVLKNYARFMFNANSLPSDIEHNHAFFRRFLIIEFDQTIPKDKVDPNLANKIKADELSGVFNWVLEGLTRLLENRNFTKCPEIDDAVLNFKKESDAVNLFIEDGDLFFRIINF